MSEFREKYINPFTDYGFKKLFGEEPNKDLLRDFLNELLRDQEGEIKSITYLQNEHVGTTAIDRKAIFDIYCENEKGEKFIVELQKSKQNFFKDRTIYYSTFPIREQAKRADWNFELKSVYTIAILDFNFDEDKHTPEKYRYDVKLTDQDTKEVFYDKLTFIYLCMPKFNKSIDQLETKFDKWLYVIKNLHTFERIPVKLQEKIFKKLFQTAELAKFTQNQIRSYESSLKYYRDMKNSLDTAEQDGFEKGIKEGIKEGIEKGIEKGLERGMENKQSEMIKGMLKQNIDIKTISIISGLSEEQILKLGIQKL